MPDNVEHDTVQARKLSRGGTQFSLRGMFLLTAAFAYWLWLLSDFRREPIAIAVFWAITIAAGIGGHLLHTYLLPWRGTVVITLLVLPPVIFGAVAGLLGAGDAVVDILTIPIEFFAHQRWSDRMRFTIPVFASIAVLAAAHPLKPGLLTAIISAIGVSLWYGMAILIAANAG